MAIIETHELTRRFGAAIAVNRLTLSVEAGDFSALSLGTP